MDISTAKCRLCLSQKDLVLVFNCDDVGHKKMKELILLTTGVEILEKDVVSRKICANCNKIVIKMHEFRERSIKADKYLKEKIIEHLRATKMKIPNTNVTISTTKLQKEQLDDFNHNIYQNELTEVNGSKKDENFIILDSYSFNADIPKKVKVHESVSQLFTRYPNLKLRTDVLIFDVNPFISLELDAVEKYCSDNNIDLKLATKRAMEVNTARKKTTPFHNKNILNSDSSLETNISENKSFSKNNLENDHAPLKVGPISIKLVDDRTNFKVTPISIKLVDDHAKFKIISNHSSKRKRESSESKETITETKQSKIKRRRISSSDCMSDTDTANSTLFKTLELKPSHPSSKQIETHKCNICLSLHKSPKALKFHYQEHFCCSFCRARFRLIERRISHEKKCTVGHALNSKLYVKLKRVDLDSIIRNKYLNCNPVINKNSLHCNEVIVLSDDDEPVKSTNLSNSFISKPNSGLSVGIPEAQNILGKVNMPEKQIQTVNAVVATESSSIEKVINECETELNKVTTYFSSKSNTLLQSPSTVGNNEILPQAKVSNTPNTEILPVKYSSTAIVRPDIKIQNDAVLNTNNLNGSDIILLKDLLRHAKRFKSLKLPSTEDITRNGIMKNMFLQLGLYKVPVNIRHGPNSVTISDQESTTNKEVTMWNDVKPLPLFNKKANVDSNNITLKPSETNLINTVKTNNPATVQPRDSVSSIVNSALLKIRQTLGILTNNTQYFKTHCSSQDQTIVSSSNILSHFSAPVTSPNVARTISSQHFTPNFLNTPSAQLFNSTNNTSPLNSNASSPQRVLNTPNNAIVNNATHNYRQEFIPLSSTSINLTNDISQVFRSPGVMTNSNHTSIVRPHNTSQLNRNASFPQIVPHTLNNAIVNNTTNNSRQEFINLSINSPNSISQNFISPGSAIMTDSNNPSISRPVSNPVVTDRNFTNCNRSSSTPKQKYAQFTYSKRSNQQLTAPLSNNQCVLLNPLVANCFTTQYNNLQQNTLNTPMIRVKSIHELK
ncbi:unnamed protein product [Diabrotica balteata]|uniref:ZAD domain-containing protein n=1 Tax=Diabrotica balteata TaxID=107213 RepID=A0A9N9T5W9_DIABA|nr:unnamed protein product [Diabrotica balteata]